MFNYIECMTFSSPNSLESTFLVDSVDVFSIRTRKTEHFQPVSLSNGEP